MAKQDISKLKDWFRTGNFPTQEQFWDWMDSFVHKDDKLGITANFPELDQVLQQKAEKSAFIQHTGDRTNPHQVTKEQVGLSSVDNTADMDKPISTLIQAALDSKAEKSGFDDHLKNNDNPHQVTKLQIGLGNVDNTADASKPISKPMKAALDLKAEKEHIHTVADLTGFDTDVTLAGNSDEKVASQKAVKAYVDDQVKTKLSQTSAPASTGCILKAGTTSSPTLKFPQGALLTTPQNGAWEWDGNDLYFTAKGTRQSMIQNHVFSSQTNQSDVFMGTQSGHIEITSDSAPAGILSTWGLARLHALVQIDIQHGGVPSSKFNIVTDVFLQIKNGSFYFCDENNTWRTDSALRIAAISFTSGWKLKEIDIPIISSFFDIGESKKGSNLIISSISDIDDKKSTFRRTAILRNSNSENIGAEEASFGLLVKSRMTTTKSGDTLDNPVQCHTAISSFTLSRINAMTLPN